MICSLPSPIGVEGIKQFLQSDDIDVWRVTADGMADIRINKDLLQKDSSYAEANTKCTIIANVEALVQQFEKTSKKSGVKASWFEEYVRMQ